MLLYSKSFDVFDPFPATYKTVWVAGPSIEFSHGIENVAVIAKRLIAEYEEAYKKLVERQDS